MITLASHGLTKVKVEGESKFVELKYIKTFSKPPFQRYFKKYILNKNIKKSE